MKLKEFTDRLDLKKRFPGYFNIWIFRAFHLMIAILILVVCIVDGPEVIYPGKQFVDCYSDEPCINPYYQGNEPFFAPTGNPIYDQEIVYPGETLGDKPSGLSLQSHKIILLLFVWPFIINHLIHYWRNKKE